MAAMGYCPSGRLFEAAACGCPIVSDNWQGLEEFFGRAKKSWSPRRTDDALSALVVHATPNWRESRAPRASACWRNTPPRVVRRSWKSCSIATRRAGNRRGLTCGDHSSRGRRQPHSAARVFEGTAAGRQPPRWHDRAPARGQRISDRAHDDRRRGQDLLRDRAGKVGHPRILRRRHGELGELHLRRAAAARRACATRSSARCRLIAPNEPVAIGLPDTIWFPGRRPSLRCRTMTLSFLLFPGRAAGALRRGGDGRARPRARDPGEAARRARRTGSGARSRCRAAFSTNCIALARAPAARRIHRHAGECVARARRRRVAGFAPANRTSMSARWTDIAKRSAAGVPEHAKRREAIATVIADRNSNDASRSSASGFTIWICSGVQTAPDHFLGDYPRVKLARLRARAACRPARQDACSISAATPASTRSR